MDLSLIFTTIIMLLASAIAFKILKLEWRRYRYSRTIPSKKVSIFNIFGNLSDLKFTVQGRNGYSLNAFILQSFSGLSQLFKVENLCCFWVFYSPFVILKKAEAIEKIVTNNSLLEKGWSYKLLHPWLGTGILTSAGEKWKSRRRLMTPSFHSGILRTLFLPVFNEKAKLLTHMLRMEANHDSINIVRPITLCSLDIVCETILGVRGSSQEIRKNQYVKSVAVLTRLFFQRVLNIEYWFNFTLPFTKLGTEFTKNVEIVHQFTNTVIREKKQRLLREGVKAGDGKRKALLDLLLEHHLKTNALSEEDIREEVDTLVFEGHDTTSMGMTWALYLIGLHEEIQSRIQEEIDTIFADDVHRPVTIEDLVDMKYLSCVLKESQRLYPSVPMISRLATEDITICGKRIPKGSIINLMIYLLHRDETVFPDPEKFDPERFLPENSIGRHPFAYIPFSAGSRNCIGQKFALMEEKVVVSTILRHFKIQSLDPRDRVVPGLDMVLRPAGPVRIRIRLRST